MVRTEKEIYDMLLQIAREDERIKAVYMNGSRTNKNVPKDIFQDYDIVYVVSVGEYGKISDHFTDSDGNENYIIKLDNGKIITSVDDIEVQYDEALPLYGCMWTFKDPFDIEWLENNLQTMANCGFRIYESEDYDYVFGIDSIGCDYYEHYWIPLYDAMGLNEYDEKDDE